MQVHCQGAENNGLARNTYPLMSVKKAKIKRKLQRLSSQSPAMKYALIQRHRMRHAAIANGILLAIAGPCDHLDAAHAP
jgi:hypothetical protein